MARRSSPASNPEAWPAPPAVVWNDVENGGYDADRKLWLDLARRVPGPVLEIGAGTGRVALALASAGHRVTGVDVEVDLLKALRRRARERDLAVDAIRCDARKLALDRTFGLIVAPMQVAQLLGGAAARIAFFGGCAEHLLEGGLVAVAIVDRTAQEDFCRPAEFAPPPPDMRELDGWLFSSLALPASMRDDEHYEFRRLRTAVSPAGAVHETWATVCLNSVDREGLFDEARAAGLSAARSIDPVVDVPAADGYVGSTVLAFERSGDGDEG